MKTVNKIRCAAALIMALTLLCVLCCGSALGESISMEGTVTPASTVLVTAPIGGMVEEVCVEAGQVVSAGETLCVFRTTGVYAQEAGTITGIFAQVGDDAETVANDYGAVLYLQGAARYRISASLDQAYASQETKEVRVGEKVYLAGRTSTDRKGEGVIITVDGSSFTVEVTKGSFFPKDSVDVYRDSAFTYNTKLGRGTVSLVNPVAVSASGAIVSIAVEDGQTVERGQLLLETLEGSFDGLVSTGDTVTAPQDGVVASVSASAGSTLSKGTEVAVLWSTEAMRAEFLVPESDRNAVKVGDTVTIELLSGEEEKTYQGTVVFLSAVAAEGEDSVCYRALAEFTPDDEVAFGMRVLVSTAE